MNNNRPIARIDYLHTDGSIGESYHFHTESEFLARVKEQKETAAAEKVYRPENNGRFHKPRQSEKLKENDISAVMEEAHDSAEEGEIYDEGVRDDIPG